MTFPVLLNFPQNQKHREETLMDAPGWCLVGERTGKKKNW